MQDVFSGPGFKAGITLVSGCFYGFFFALFVLSTLLLNRQCKKGVGSQMSSTNVYLASSYMMFIVLTTTWIISAIMSFNPHLVHLPPPPLLYPPLIFAQWIVGQFACLIGDLVLIYRLYVIWDQRKIVIWIGGILVLSALGLGIGVVVRFAQTRIVFATLEVILGGLTISTNITATILIARTVWKRSELTRAVGGQKIIYKLIAIIVESSALYTFWTLSFMISYFKNIVASQIFLYSTPYVAGIAAMLINVRVALGWAVGEEGRSVRSFHDSASIHNHPNHDSVDQVAGGTT